METTFSKDRNITFNYIAFFDLDQTITKSISGRALARRAYQKGFMTHWDLLNAIFLSFVFRFKLKDPLKIIDNMVSWVKGIPENIMVDLCYEVFHQVLLPSVYKEARAEIAYHKTNNARVVLLSSALTAICQEMAANLGIDDIICSELEVKNGYLTGRPVGHLCFGDEKAVRLMAYCDKNIYSASDAWYYGDSISDLTALKAVGNPVCVNPDKKLKKEALKRVWKILTWEN
jgi:HAD superfamily hydrolase (TIGR01490 family)